MIKARFEKLLHQLSVGREETDRLSVVLFILEEAVSLGAEYCGDCAMLAGHTAAILRIQGADIAALEWLKPDASPDRIECAASFLQCFWRRMGRPDPVLVELLMGYASPDLPSDVINSVERARIAGRSG